MWQQHVISSGRPGLSARGREKARGLGSAVAVRTVRKGPVRRALALGVVVLLIVAGGIVTMELNARVGHRTDGPIQISDEIRITYELEAGPSTTWGMPLDGVLGKVVALKHVEPLDVVGLDVLGVRTCSGVAPAGGDFLHCAPLNSGGWPPEGVATREVADTVIDGAPRSSVGILIGLRRQTTASVATISNVRIVYTTDGDTYEVVQPWSLRLVPSGALELEESPD